MLKIWTISAFVGSLIFSESTRCTVQQWSILSIFRQPLHVSGLSRPIIRRYNRWYLVNLQDARCNNKVFLVYFVNLYMYRAYLDPSSGGTIVYIQQFVLIILLRWLSVVLVALFQSNQDNRKQTKYTKNKLRIKLVFLHDYIEMHGQQNRKLIF